MYCKNCGKEVNENAAVCISCGFNPLTEKNFCQHCGTATNPNQVICVKCGCSLATSGAGNSLTNGGSGGFIDTITNNGKVPVIAGWIINVVAWVLFVATMNHAIEFIMGIACIYAFFIGKKHAHSRLMYSSIFDAIWMFAWSFGHFGGGLF